MANAFQEQLLKAGLVSKDKVNKSNKSKYKKAKQQPKNRNAETDKLKNQVKKETLARVERDRELNRQKIEQENKKAITAQIKQLVEMNCISIDERDEDVAIFNFEVDGKVEGIYLTDEIRKQVINGRLAIVRLNDKFELVPKIVADKITQRDTQYVVLSNEATIMRDEDDEYADYKVPDDLLW